MSQLQSTGHRIELSYHNTQPSLSNSPPVNIKNKTKCRKKSDHQNYEVNISKIKKKTQKKLKKTSPEEEDESSIKSRLNKRQALEATKKIL